jgi:5-formyltetrahydrofolate cyclo-ligase
LKNKAKIRANVLLKMRNFISNEKKQETLEILSKLVLSNNFVNSGSIGLFMNTEFEFELFELFRICKDKKKKIFVPKTFSHHQMAFIELEEKTITDYLAGDLERQSETQQLARGKFGIWEPRWGIAGVPDLIVVPGVAWNSKGHRIGYGGGFYDRYLANFKGHTVSLIYDFQKAEFEAELHDIAVKEIFSV